MAADPLVLIIDDDKDFVFLLSSALKRRGAVVESSGAAFGLVARAAGLGEATRPDVIVLDCDLVALSGTSALGLLAKNPKAAEVPVVVVSASLRPDIRDHVALHANANFVAKDGRFPALADAILARLKPVTS